MPRSAKSADGKLVYGQETAQQCGHVEAIGDGRVECGKQRFDGAPSRRREFQQTHILALDVFHACRFAADLEQSARRVDAEGFGVGQRIAETLGPETAPRPVIADRQRARSRCQPANQLAAVENIGIADDNRSGTQPGSGRGKRPHHICFGPTFIGEIGEAWEIDHAGAIAAHDADFVRSAAAQCRHLALDQWLARQFEQAFRTVVAQLAHATATSGGEDHGAHHLTQRSAPKTRRKSITSAGENGEHRSGCHIMPVMGAAAWRIALTTPSSATAQTSSGASESDAAKR